MSAKKKTVAFQVSEGGASPSWEGLQRGIRRKSMCLSKDFHDIHLETNWADL